MAIYPFNTIIRYCMLALCLLAVSNVYAQQSADTSDKVRIHILHADVMIGMKTDSGDYMKSKGQVIMQQGTDTLYCDSLYQNKTTNIVEAFSNVRIAQQDGTQATSDYLRYTANKKLAYMSGNVLLTDGKNTLEGEEITYDLGTKIGTFDNWAKLKNDSTTVTSKRGEYNVKTKDARFSGNALITDPQYVTKSEDVGYNTETKTSTFYAKSVVKGDSGRMTLHTPKGYYNSLKGEAYFTEHSSIQDGNNYIEGDTLYYNKLTGLGYGYSHVISIDTSRHSTLFCGRVTYNQKKRIMWAMIKPVIEQVNGKDTLYLRADTFYSAPIPGYKSQILNLKSQNTDLTDTVKSKGQKVNPKYQSAISEEGKGQKANPKPVISEKKEAVEVKDQKSNTKSQNPAATDTIASYTTNKKDKKKKKETAAALPIADTAAADSTAPLMFIGYHHVKIFSDSLQGVCDSIIYTQHDSTIRMIYAPIAWSRNSQITGDTICLLIDSSKLRSIYVPNNTFIVSRSGPKKAKLYDQVQGKILKGFFKNNAITNIVVYPNAEVIDYTLDEHNAYIGVMHATGNKLHVFFDDQKIKTIKFESDVHQTLTPMEKADLPNEKLSRFKWLEERRPRSKEELFE